MSVSNGYGMDYFGEFIEALTDTTKVSSIVYALIEIIYFGLDHDATRLGRTKTGLF